MEKILLNIVLLATFLWPVIGFRPYMEPFFFLCNYHGNNEEVGGVDKGEVALSVSVEGNPEYYTPDHFYNSKYLLFQREAKDTKGKFKLVSQK